MVYVMQSNGLVQRGEKVIVANKWPSLDISDDLHQYMDSSEEIMQLAYGLIGAWWKTKKVIWTYIVSFTHLFCSEQTVLPKT